MMPSSVAPTLLEPFLGVGKFGRRRRQAEASCASRRYLLREALRAPCGARRAAASISDLPSSSASRSNTISSAGVSFDKLGDPARRRMNALQQASNENALPCGTTISPSSTNCLALSARDRFDQLGEIARQRLAGFRLQLDRCRRRGTTRQRKPSHFGSYCHSVPTGISSTDSASIGASFLGRRETMRLTNANGRRFGRPFRKYISSGDGSDRAGKSTAAASASARRRPGARRSRRS